MPICIQENISLKKFNTFRFDATARYLAIISTLDELRDATHWANYHAIPIKMVGEGSNLLVTEDVNALVLINRLSGLTLTERENDYLLTVAAGENWHKTVTYTVDNNMGGLENLALIPGSVGACPIQNIGAYGVEAGEFIDAIEVLDRETLTTKWLLKHECQFAYRDSRFKHDWATKYFILAVRFILNKHHEIKASYSGLSDLLPLEPTIKDVYKSVCQTRIKKLPDPNLIGNAGSFFKNPIVSQQQYDALLRIYPDLVAFPMKDNWKLAAGWLIEKAGWKGYKKDGVGVYEKQALCLVNHATDDGKKLMLLEQAIKQDINDKFNVELEREPIRLV
ncbi:UDP-N-acetylmuramate dehydrogenase [Marinomonas agarivorans]|nr:UDP-N-acetylmuramate dehydrogenase [Marinomonas agarivorans]